MQPDLDFLLDLEIPVIQKATFLPIIPNLFLHFQSHAWIHLASKQEIYISLEYQDCHFNIPLSGKQSTYHIVMLYWWNNKT